MIVTMAGTASTLAHFLMAAEQAASLAPAPSPLAPGHTATTLAVRAAVPTSAAWATSRNGDLPTLC